MTKIRLATVVLILSLLLSTVSCDRFFKTPKPTQVVDLPPMLGKSLQELTTKLGPSKERGICHHWDLTEGELSACYGDDIIKKKMSSLSYRFRLLLSSLFIPRMAAGSPEEMAIIVNINLQGRKPDTEFRGGLAYDDLSLNGKAVDVAFDGRADNIVGVRVNMK